MKRHEYGTGHYTIVLKLIYIGLEMLQVEMLLRKGFSFFVASC